MRKTPSGMKQPLRTLVLALCCGLAAACTQRPERLKLMSYNIRNGIGIDNIQDIGRIAQVILREAPDLVALQETGQRHAARGRALHPR